MKKSMKILSVLLMIVMLLIAVSPVVFAEEAKKPSDFVTPNTDDTGSVSDIGYRIAGIIKVVGMFAAVIAIMFVGVKYMMGSAEEKAEYKKVLVPYLIGAVLLFGASAFADKIYEWASNLGK